MQFDNGKTYILATRDRGTFRILVETDQPMHLTGNVIPGRDSEGDWIIGDEIEVNKLHIITYSNEVVEA